MIETQPASMRPMATATLRSERPAAAVRTGEVRTLEVDGIEVRIEGDPGPAIVMVHGWPDTWRLWDAQVAHFRASHRCVRFTLPGFDVSRPARPMSFEAMVAFLHQVIDAVSPSRPVVLMLHDWGAAYGYALADAHPSRVAAIVGVDVGDAGSREHVQSLSAVSKAMVMAYQGWLLLGWRVGGRLGDAMSRGLALLARAPAATRRVGAVMNYPYDPLWTGRMGPRTDSPGFAPLCPMLFIYGRRKPFMFHSAAWAESLASAPPHRVRSFATGHWVMTSKPAQFNRAVQEWLQTLPA